MHHNTMCKHCDHFVGENVIPDDEIKERKTDVMILKDGSTVCRYVHFEDGEQEFDHDAEPGETRSDWDTFRPDLFQRHDDDAVGPNSIFHTNRRGKIDLGVVDMFEKSDNLAIMDELADIIANRHDLDILSVKNRIVSYGVQKLYQTIVGQAVDRVAKEIGLGF